MLPNNALEWTRVQRGRAARMCMLGPSYENMTAFARLRYSFFFAVIVVGCAVVMDMVVPANIGELVFSPLFFGAALLVGLIVSPWLATRFPIREEGSNAV